MSGPRPSSRRPAAVAALLLLVACSAQSTAPSELSSYRAEPPAHWGGTLVIGDWEAPRSLDPLSPLTETDRRLDELLFAPLWGFDPDLRPYPNLVSEVPTVENGDVKVGARGEGMSVTIRLVPGLRWSDGRPITSDDVIFSWQALRDPALAGGAPGFERITSMTRRSDRELTWEITGGILSSYLQLGPRLRPLPKHRLRGVPVAQWSQEPYFSHPDVTSGPFTVVQGTGELITLDANLHYAAGRQAASAYTGRGGRGLFDHPAALSRIAFRVYASRDALIAGQRAGDIDLALHLGVDDRPLLAGLSESRTVTAPGLEGEYLNPNHDLNTESRQPPPWAGDGAVLEALSLAVDRPALVGAVAAGGRPSSELFPGVLGYGEAAGLIGGRDLAGARRLLRSRGWQLGPDHIWARDGGRLEFGVFAPCDSPPRLREQELLRRQWAELGAALSVDCRPASSLFAPFADQGLNATGAFEMSLYSNTWPGDPSGWSATGRSDQIPTPGNPGGQNWNRCRDPKLDADLARAQSSLDAGQRRQAYLAAQREWLTYHCTIPLFEWPIIRQVSTHLHNFHGHPVAGLDTWNAADWWIQG